MEDLVTQLMEHWNGLKKKWTKELQGNKEATLEEQRTGVNELSRRWEDLERQLEPLCQEQIKVEQGHIDLNRELWALEVGPKEKSRQPIEKDHESAVFNPDVLVGNFGDLVLFFCSIVLGMLRDFFFYKVVGPVIMTSVIVFGLVYWYTRAIPTPESTQDPTEIPQQATGNIASPMTAKIPSNVSIPSENPSKSSTVYRKVSSTRLSRTSGTIPVSYTHLTLPTIA